MGKDIVLVLGSGATVGGKFLLKLPECGKCKPPMDWNFFESEAVRFFLKDNKYPALKYYQRVFQDNSMEATWSRIDILSKMCCSGIVSEELAYKGLKSELAELAGVDKSYGNKLLHETKRKCNTLPSMAGWEFRKLISDIYSKVAHDDIKSSPLKTLVGSLMKRLRSVITFNYDLSLEQVLEQVLEHGNCFYYPCLENKQEGHLPVFKLHGSLNWQETSATEFIQVVGGFAEFEHTDEGYKQPSVIGPTIFKQEINMDTQQDWRGKFYKLLWEACWQELHDAQNRKAQNRKAQTIIFAGFGFPHTDWHIRTLFETAHRDMAGDKGRFKNVIFCHKGDTNNGYATVRKIFKDANTSEHPNGLEDFVKHELECVLKRI